MPVKLALSGDPAADKLLSRDSLALLIGMVLDQQVPLEWAFAAPLRLKERLGGRLDAAEIAAMDPDALVKVFSQTPALHRFPGANAKRVQELCRIVVDQYKGKADRVWKSAKTGDELLANVKALPGFGEQKARIFVGLLGKQLGVQPRGWEKAAGDFGKPGTFVSVADITGPEALAKVREHKQAMKAKAKADAGR
ncbi:MAG: Fe-S cluster assembly protein HesB [Actinobacteria bacterium]|nr:Fe-S cluster assembly protein HesB [Actinomycetota bacterium]